MISGYAAGALMAASSPAPLKRAPIGPILISTVATMRVSDSLVSDWQPGMQRRSTSGSLSACQTLSRAAAIRCSPDIFIDTFSWLTRLADEPRRRTLAALRADRRGRFDALPRAVLVELRLARMLTLMDMRVH